MPMQRKKQLQTRRSKARAKPAARKQLVQQKKKPKQTRQRRPACSSGSWFHADHPQCPPVVSAIGSAVPVPNRWTKTLNVAPTGSGRPYIFCFTLRGSDHAIGFEAYLDTTPVVTLYTGIFANAYATSAKPAKLTVRMSNFTQMLNRGGILHYLVTDRRLEFPTTPTSMTKAQWDAAADRIRSHPDTRVKDMAHLRETEELFVTPRDSTHYNEFAQWVQPPSVNDFARSVTEVTGLVNKPFPMSAIWVVIDTPAESQALRLEAHFSQYMRFPLDDAMSALSKPVPTTTQDKHNQMVKQGISEGSILKARLKTEDYVNLAW